MAYTFDKPRADAPSRASTQYFEMFGNRALYRDGWIACCRHGRLPWENVRISAASDDDTWELYHIAEDFSQAVDLAAQGARKLRELQDLFMAEAAKYNVLPLDDRFVERADVTLRPSYFYGRKQVTFYPGMVRLPEGSAPKTHGVRHTITAPVEIPDGGAEGVLCALGGDTAGWSLFLWEGKPRYHYNFFGLKRYDVMSPDKLSPGAHARSGTDLHSRGPHPGSPANATLSVDGKAVGETQIEFRFRCGAVLRRWTSGMDCVSPVCTDYEKKGLFPFTGSIESVTFEFGAATVELTGMDRLKMAAKMD